MKNNTEERFRVLQASKSQSTSYKSSYSKDLDINDLLLLLRHDEDIRAAIREIFSGEKKSNHLPDTLLNAGIQQSCRSTESVPEYVQKPLGQNSIADPLPSSRASPSLSLQGFTVEQRLLKLVLQDNELRQDWLGDLVSAPLDRQLVKVIVRASQWQQLDALWERLAQRCRTGQRPAQAQELELLTAGLALHNLNWEGRAATLQFVPVGERYDPHTQQRGNRSGDRVKVTWLPGLVNAGGQLVKLPMIETN